MGIAGSRLSDGSVESPATGLGDLPESCVASILTHFDPEEICRLAMINRVFSGASTADFVWESKLPKNYRLLAREAFNDFPERMCKKEIYMNLARPNSIDENTKRFWLDKSSGRICLLVPSRELSITGIDDRRYWNRIPTEESRFGTVAYLHQTWWLEVSGGMEFPLPAGSYSLFFRLHLGRIGRRFGRRVCSSEHVHGWDLKPVQFQLWTSDGQISSSHSFLDLVGSWVCCHAGDFLVGEDGASSSTKVKFSMTQIDCTHTKGGLCIDSVFICPSSMKELI